MMKVNIQSLFMHVFNKDHNFSAPILISFKNFLQYKYIKAFIWHFLMWQHIIYICDKSPYKAIKEALTNREYKDQQMFSLHPENTKFLYSKRNFRRGWEWGGGRWWQADTDGCTRSILQTPCRAAL